MKCALKEWAVIVHAIKQGRHHLLLRKGGLADKGGTFQIENNKFLFFPTYEHQESNLIQDKYVSLYTQLLKSSLSQDELFIECWGEVKEVFKVREPEILKELEPFHIWSEEYIKMRLNYKPEKPLYLILLRTYHLPAPQKIKNLKRYGGCRSWIQLEDEIGTESSTPISSETDFKILSQTIISHFR